MPDIIKTMALTGTASWDEPDEGFSMTVARVQGLVHVEDAVVYERDEDGWWFAYVPSIPGCHTQGRTIDQARQRIGEALTLWMDDTDTATLDDSIPHRP